MSIELKQAAQQAVDAFDAFGDADDFASLFELAQKMRALRTAIQQAEAQQPAPGMPGGQQWLTVAEDGLPEVGEVVIGGLWYTDPWLKPDRATSFMWGQCSMVSDKHPDFKEGKRWLTFGPAHSQITHWARLTPPAMLAASPAQKGGE